MLRRSAVQLSSRAARQAYRAATLQCDVCHPPAAAAAAPTQQVRHFGVLDSISAKLTARQEAKKEDIFRKQLEDMLSVDQFTLDTFLQQVERGMSTWQTKVPILRSQPQVLEMRKRKAILEAFTPDEREHPDRIGQAARLRAAGTAKETLNAVEQVMSEYEQSECVHRWLKAREKKGQRLPKSQEELQELARDPRGITMMKFVKNPPERFAKGMTSKKKQRQPLVF